MTGLAAKTALVTGAPRGIGRTIAQRLAADGAEVAIHYGANEAAAKETVARIVCRVQIGMLGPFEVRTDGGVLADVPGARLRGRLIALALKPGHVVPTGTAKSESDFWIAVGDARG